MTVSGRFVVLVAIGAIPVIALGQTGASATAALAGWVLLCVIVGTVDLTLAASPRRLVVERMLPTRVRLGEPVISDLFVSNNGRRRIRGQLRDGWEPSAGAPSARTRIDIPPLERRRVQLRLIPTRRGERRVDDVTVRSWGPLGIWARQATLRAPGRIRVLPPFNSRKHLPSRLARLRELDGNTSVLIRGQGTEFDSLREYVRGDDVRSIDWRATARRADVTVRTWRPERDRRVVIVIDTSRTSAARVQDEPRIDTSFEATLLLAALASRAGDHVDMVAFDRRVHGRVHGASGAELLSRLVDELAVVEPELIEMDWAGVPQQIDLLTRQRALVVVLTAVESPGTAHGLLSVLPQLTRKHTVLVASVTDPAVLSATRIRSNREEIYQAAAAERALLDITRVAAAIRTLGADVVTGSPDELPLALSDRYIALKAAGLL